MGTVLCISVLVSQSVMLSRLCANVTTMQCAQCMVQIGGYRCDGTIELELNFVHMWETKETVLTGREEAALDS
jgi:hypothetical protein